MSHVAHLRGMQERRKGRRRRGSGGCEHKRMHICCCVYCPAPAGDGGSCNSSAKQHHHGADEGGTATTRVYACNAYLQHVSLFRRRGPGVHDCWSSATVAQGRTLLHPLLMPSRALQVRAVAAGPVSRGTSWGCTGDSSRPVCGANCTMQHWAGHRRGQQQQLAEQGARCGVVLLLLLWRCGNQAGRCSPCAV